MPTWLAILLPVISALMGIIIANQASAPKYIVTRLWQQRTEMYIEVLNWNFAVEKAVADENGQSFAACRSATRSVCTYCFLYAQPKCFMTASMPLCSWFCSALVSGAWSQYASTNASRTGCVVGPQLWKRVPSSTVAWARSDTLER
jgi:hypothetical protein